MADSNNVWHRLQRALSPVSPANLDGPWTLAISGGGAGGTSTIDNSPFTPGGSGLTPAGGYVGGRSIASGNTGVIGLSPSGAVLVHVIAGGAGGGLAQLQVVGSDGAAFVNVGYPSGGSPTFNSVPVMVMNQVAGGGGFASVAVYGSPATPVYAIGSVNVVNVLQVTSPAGSLNIIGSINPHGVFAPAGSVNVYGSVNIANAVGIFGSVSGVQTVNLATHIDTANSAVRVNVVTGGAGGGVANLTVRGTANTDIQVGYASGAGFNVAGGAYVPILGTVNLGAGASPFASVAVYGSPAMPVYVVGSMFLVNGSLPMINFGGSVGALGIGGSMGVTQIGAPWSFVGSTNVTPLTAFSLAGIPQVDPRGSLVPTQWIISAGGSGQFVIAGSAPATQRNYVTGYRFISTGTVDVQFQSPSGVAISGSMRILPGAGIVDSGGGNWPVLVGSQQSPVFMLLTGTQNVGGWANGYIAP